MKTEIIRVYLLEQGDHFLKCGIHYYVRRIADNKIHYCVPNAPIFYACEMGINSREKIELICPSRIPAKYSFINN